MKNNSMIKLFIPAFVEMLSMSILSVINGIMVSHISEDAMSAVSIVDTVSSVLMTMFIAVSTGATVKVAQYIGSARREDAKKVAEQSILLSVLISIVVVLCLLIFGDYILKFLFGDSTESIISMARTHQIMSSISYVPFAVFSVTIAIFRGAGDFKVTLIANVIINVLHIIGTGFFIFVCNFGVASIGASLILCRTVCAAMNYIVLKKGTKAIEIGKVWQKLERKWVSAVLKISLPSAIDSVVFHGGRVVVQTFITAAGTVALASNAIIGNLSNLIMVPGNTMMTIAVTLVGQKFGTGDIAGTRKEIWKVTFVSLALQCIVGVATLLFANPMIGFYNPSPEVAAQTLDLMLVVVIGCCIFWNFGYVTAAGLRAVGDAKYITVISIISMWVGRVFGSWLLAVQFNMGVMGVWCTIAIESLMRGAFYCARVFSHKWERLDRI